MKSQALFILSILTSVSAFSHEVLSNRITYRCKQETIAVNPMTSSVVTANLIFTGSNIVEVEVNKIRPRKKSVETYLVTKDKQNSNMGGPTVFRGDDDMSLSVNFTTNPLDGYKATLVESNKTTHLICKKE